MKAKITLLIFTTLALAFLLSCLDNSTPDQDNNPLSENIDLSPGFLLSENSCFSCHSPNPDLENPVAPSMAAIKEAYLKDANALEEYREAFLAFLQGPDPASPKMPEAVEQYGLMPAMDLTEEQIIAIANYSFLTPLEKKGWYENEYPQQQEKYRDATTKANLQETGKNIAMKTKGVLGKNLLNALKTKGAEGAVEFCSTRAYPLTDSMALALGASVKRVSDKNRNPDNAANEMELQYIAMAKKQLAASQQIQPQMQTINGRTVAYYPILSNEMCLQCHGSIGTDILPATHEKIKALYPDDKATGYGLNELRGIWVVEFEK